MTLLKARDVSVPGRLHPTLLDCGPAEMIAIIGPNGAGKTSLLRSLAGIDLQHGQVTVRGEHIASAPPIRKMRLLSFLPATRALVWPMTARDVIALGLPRPEPSRVEELIRLLELDELAERSVNSLSTGERSRVLLARALAAQPYLLLLDEPLSNLDPYWVLRVLALLRACAAETGCAVLASLHDLSQAGAFDRVLLVDQGRIIADGPPAEILASRELTSAFRIELHGKEWRLKMPADRQSSL